jgi:DNA-binding SARP family transcriptional activator
MPPLELTLFGGFEARRAPGVPVGIGRRKAEALLAYLACSAGQGRARDALAALLWPESSETAARHSIRQALLTLRRALPPGVIRVDEVALALDPTAFDVDVLAFERLIANGSPEALEQAASLYRGDFLAGFNVKEAPFEEWLQSERERLRELALETLARVLATQRASNDLPAALQTALRLLALDPLQEVVHRTVMRLQAAQGRRDAALRQYQACVDVLERELGVEPEPETKELYREILRERGRSSPVKEPPRVEERLAGDSRRAPLFRSPDTGSPMIGRDAELARLGHALDAAGQRGKRLIAVLGEAGIGKSRLLAEFASSALDRGARVLLGQSYHSTAILPFGPWIDALRRDGIVADVTRIGLDAAWQRELARLFPELGKGEREFATNPEDASRLFESIAQLLERLAARQPVAVLLEDVHWADGMTVRLLASLARRPASGPLLLVASARDDELADVMIVRDVLRELDAEGRLDRLALAPLSRGETGALVRRLVRTGTEPAALAPLADRLWTASHGNPFVVVETMAALEQGFAVASPSVLPLPERVREIVLRHLDRLSDGGRSLVAVAAVIGREFTFALLRQAAALDERAAADGLEELVRRRILRVSGGSFDFTHDRIREVVISELLPPRRMLLNRQVAEALEGLAPGAADRDWSALGAHYRDAELWESAARSFRQAAGQASGRFANREAAACLEEALAAAGRLPRTRGTLELTVDLHLELRNALLPVGDMVRVGACLRGAEEVARRLDDAARRAWVSLYAHQYQWWTDEAYDARTFAEQAQAAAQDVDDASLMITGTLYAGFGWYMAGEYRQAEGSQARVLESLTSDVGRGRHGYHPLPIPAAHSHLANALAELGEFSAGIEHGRQALRSAEAVQDWYGMTLGFWALGGLHRIKGDYAEAIRLLERGVALVRDRRRSSPVIGTLGHTYAVAGRIHDGLALLEEARAALDSVGFALLKSRLLAHLGEACLLAGRVDDALGFADQALRLARQRGERGDEAWTLRLHGEIHSRRHPCELERAAGSYRMAQDLAHRLGMRPLSAHCHLGLGRLYRRAGKPEADGYVSLATTMYREMGMPFWVEQAQAESGPYDPHRAADPALERNV